MILTIGLSCLDQFFFIERIPPENHKIYADDFMQSGGGPCGNAAFLLGKWGEEIYHITTLQQNLAAKTILSELKSVGVNCDYCLCNQHQITPLSTILINSENGSRTIITHKNNRVKSLPTEYQQLLDSFIDQLNHAQQPVIILIDGHEVEISEYMLAKISNKIVIMDAGNYKQSLIRLAKYVNYFVASEAFIKGLLNTTALTYPQLATGLNILADLSDNKHLPVITLGEKGVVYLEKNQVKHIAAYACQAVDTTGAGDIFHGAFVYGIKQQWHIEKIIKFSALTAAMSIEKKGVREAIPQISEVIHHYSHHVYQPINSNQNKEKYHEK